ncbi:MAG: carbohydrate ABC transporter permease [Anaerolineae bacterium]|nr:carbohydrate ABC transporter permease [Anaerolineae bacterium]
MATTASVQGGPLSGLRRRRQINSAALYLVLTFLALMFSFPWFYTITGSLKAAHEIYLFPPRLIPEVAQFGNYPQVFQRVLFGRWFLNSVVVVTLTTLGAVISSTLVAYSFARFSWRGRDALFAITLATMMLPAEVTLIPTYLLFKELGWLNSIRPLWVPAWFGGGAFNIFLMRQFVMTLPREFDEAAKIDGASTFRILMQVLLPLMKPVISTIAVIGFIAAWDDFFGPLIYLSSTENFTIALGLRYFSTYEGQPGIPQTHFLMAACVMSTTPIVILFFFAQRYFVQGIVMSGIKG